MVGQTDSNDYRRLFKCPNCNYALIKIRDKAKVCVAKNLVEEGGITTAKCPQCKRRFPVPVSINI